MDSAETEPRRPLLYLTPGSIAASRSVSFSSESVREAYASTVPALAPAKSTALTCMATDGRGRGKGGAVGDAEVEGQSVPCDDWVGRVCAAMAVPIIGVAGAGTGDASAVAAAAANASATVIGCPMSRRCCSVLSAPAARASGLAGRCVSRYVSTS